MSDNDRKPTDPKAAQNAFNQVLRDRRNATRVTWVPSTSRDPADRERDRHALNAALREAGRRAQGDPDAA